MCLHSIFVEESYVNLSGCGALLNFKRREMQIFSFFSFFLLAHNSIRKEKPKEREWKESGTVQLCLTRPGPQQ